MVYNSIGFVSSTSNTLKKSLLVANHHFQPKVKTRDEPDIVLKDSTPGRLIRYRPGFRSMPFNIILFLCF